MPVSEDCLLFSLENQRLLSVHVMIVSAEYALARGRGQALKMALMIPSEPESDTEEHM